MSRASRLAVYRLSALLFLCLVVACTSSPPPTPTVAAEAVLPSWRDGPSRTAIASFVEQVTKPGTPAFVPEPERIAVFDNDGTLWSEQPMYFQLLFALDRVKALAPAHPEWANQEPFRSVLAGDMKGVMAGGEHALVQLVAASHANTTVEEFEQTVKDWIGTANHPKTGRPFTEMVYQPMLEMLTYLRANGFKTYIVSGGGVEFMRPWTQRVYGIPPEQVVGSRIRMKYELRDGGPVLLRLPEIDLVDDKAGKPVGIQQVIGRRPIIAFGNSDGDFEMLEWTTSGPGSRLGVIVHHTDAQREWAYDRESAIGRLVRGLDEAAARGWIVVDMKQEWNTVYR
jgi:phosphoserine phosphatase